MKPAEILEQIAAALRPKAPAKVYDGTGPSGYAGTAGAQPLTRRHMKLVPAASIPARDRPPLRGGKNSRRTRQNVWVNA